MNCSRSKILVKYFVKQRCADELNSGVKGLNQKQYPCDQSQFGQKEEVQTKEVGADSNVLFAECCGDL
jgi:hypothetical protein